MSLFTGSRPSITPAQIGAVIIAGIPILANLGHAFGLFEITPEQQDALKQATEWAVVSAVGLVAADAHLRGKRNEHDAAVHVAALTSPPVTTVATDGSTVVNATPADDAGAAGDHVEPEVPAGDGDEKEEDLADGLPDDEEEFASPPPGNPKAEA